MISKKNAGYTLIELLMVITVMAVIASIAILTLRERAENARIDKVAIEMQHILEAALTYYNNDRAWPAATSLPLCATQTDNAFVKNYIPNQNATSSFGYNFCWSQAGEGQSYLFWVAVQVPNSNQQIAARLAARLPNAIITSDPNSNQQGCNFASCYVRAEVTQPGFSATNNTSAIVGEGTCGASDSEQGLSTCRKIHDPSQYEITFDACPTNEVPKAIVSPNFLTIPVNRQGYSFPLRDLNAATTCSSTVDNNNKQHCIVDVSAIVCANTKCKSPKKLSSVGASYLVSCIPQTEKNKIRGKYAFY